MPKYYTTSHWDVQHRKMQTSIRRAPENPRDGPDYPVAIIDEWDTPTAYQLTNDVIASLRRADERRM